MKLLLLLSALSGVLSYNCTWRTPDGKALFDLRLLQHWFGSKTDYEAHSPTYYYKWNICGPSNDINMCASMGYAGCQYDYKGSFVSHMGFWSGAAPEWNLKTPGNPQDGLVLKFTNGEPCKAGTSFVPKTTTINMQCTGDATPQFSVNDDETKCEFHFTMKTRHACPVHQPPMPHVPSSYRASMEVTNTVANETYWVHEIWDHRDQRIRNDQFFHPGGWVTTLIEFDRHFRYSVINGTKCTRHPLSPTLMMYPSVFDLFREHANQLVYMGKHLARGILCDVWEGHWFWYHPQDGMHYREDAIWYFATGHFKVIENPSLFRRPVFAALQSNRTHPVFSGPSQHWFTFMDFQDHLDWRSWSEMHVDPRWNCPGGPPPQPPFFRDPNYGLSSGAVAGLSIFSILMGGAIGFGAHWFYLRKRGGGVFTSSPAQTYDTDGAGTGGTIGGYQDQ
jgi:hypothetical protein